jgi:UDPglucose 6-dehydrogenase
VIEREQARHGQRVRIDVASNPEFLREGTAVADTLRPDRIVYGTSSDWARDRLREIYAPVVADHGCPVVETDVPTAELIKHASNAFLATRISFINQVARICERVGADVEVVAHGMGLDERIGPHFLRAGIGYGGSCFPKDVDAFIHLAREVGEDFRMLEEVREVNASMRQLVLDKLQGELWHLGEKVVTILGAAFKPGTDDLREAPALHLASALAAEGATVRLWDPVALPRVKEAHPEFEAVADLQAAITDAHAVIVATEWDEVRDLSPQDFLDQMAYPIVVDGRNVFNPSTMIDAGVHYHAVGRT